MKNNFLVRAFFGLALVSLGGVLLLRNFDIVNDDIWSIYWGVLWGSIFVVAGLAALFASRAWFWGTIMLAIGASIILSTFNVFDVSVWSVFWPIVLLIGSLCIIFNFGSPGKKKSVKSGDNHRTAIFYGEELKPKGDYTGGSLTAVFGGIELDLRDADIKDGAVIEVFTLCGGCEITLPDDVVLKNETRGILGGVEDKTKPKKSAKKTLTVRGVCVLGGLEIR